MLLRKQKNELLQIMTDRNIFPHHVNKKDDSTTEFEIKFRDGPFFFQINPEHSGRGGEFAFLCLPGSSSDGLWGGTTWAGIIDRFKKWADEIQEELQTPDMWAQFETSAQLFAMPAAPDEKFTDHELREVQSQLRAVEHRLAASGLPEAAIKELTVALKATVTAAQADGMSKKDWKIIFVGTIVTAISGLALSPDHVQTVYEILKVAFTGWLLH